MSEHESETITCPNCKGNMYISECCEAIDFYDTCIACGAEFMPVTCAKCDGKGTLNLTEERRKALEEDREDHPRDSSV